MKKLTVQLVTSNEDDNPVEFELDEKTVYCIDQIIEVGKFGSTRAEVIEHVILSTLRPALVCGRRNG